MSIDIDCVGTNWEMREFDNYVNEEIRDYKERIRICEEHDYLKEVVLSLFDEDDKRRPSYKFENLDI